MFYFTEIVSPLGQLAAVCDRECENLVGLWNCGQKHFGGSVKIDMARKDDIPLFSKLKDWLDSYFNGEKPDAALLPLALIGGEFRQSVWEELKKIPYGKTATYGEIAGNVAVRLNKRSMSAQAVGGAVGYNPLSIIIPCHRVVGANGSLTGYAGGLEKKVFLLKHEGADMSKLFLPKSF